MKTLWFVPCSAAYRPLLLRHFLPSLVETGMAGKVDLAVIDLQPMIASGFRRFDSIIPQLDCAANYGRPCIVSGADFRFYRDFLPELHNFHDMIHTSLDRIEVSPVLCSDFLAFIINWRTLQMFDLWEMANSTVSDDQVALNDMFGRFSYPGTGPRLSNHGLPEDFWTIGLGGIPRTWEPGDTVPEPPANIALHHGNFTVGVANKLALLDAVRARVEQRNKTP